jgi:hypothetical protein
MTNHASTNPFAVLLSAAVTSSGLSRAEIAVATGYSVSAICKFMGGHNTPPQRSRQPMLDAIERAKATKDAQP